MMDALTDVQLRILEAAEGTMSTDTLEKLNKDLESDPEGRRLLDEMTALYRAEQALSDEVPEALHDYIMDGVEWNRKLDKMQRRTKVRALAAAACAALVLAGAGLAGVIRGKGSAPRSDAAETVHYAASSSSSMSGSTDEDTLAKGFEEAKFESAEEEPAETDAFDALEDYADAPTAMPGDTRDSLASSGTDGYDEGSIELALSARTGCRTIVIADSARLAELKVEPAFELDGYTVYQLTPEQFKTLDEEDALESPVYFTNHDGSEEDILLAVPQDAEQTE